MNEVEKTWAIREKEIRDSIAEAIEAIDLSEAKEISSDWYGGSSRIRMVAAMMARGMK